MYNFRLEKLDKVAPTITMFWFKPDKPLDYTAGQYIEVTLPHKKPDDRGQKRWFTLTSSPSENLLAITTRYAGAKSSSFKKTLFNLSPGATLKVTGPMGDFVLPKDTSRPLVFVAGGIGITPMRSMVKWLTDNKEHRNIQLIYAVRRSEDLIFRGLFKNYGIDITPILSEPTSNWDGETGRLTAKRIVGLVNGIENKLLYISGPEPMVDKLETDLKLSGLKADQLVLDSFPGYPLS